MTRVRLRNLASLTVVALLVATSTLAARGGRNRPAKPKDVTLTGTITDLHSYMTEKPQPTRAVQRLIRGGMPAVLETENGAVLLGGFQSPLPQLNFAGLARIGVSVLELNGKEISLRVLENILHRRKLDQVARVLGAEPDAGSTFTNGFTQA